MGEALRSTPSVQSLCLVHNYFNFSLAHDCLVLINRGNGDRPPDAGISRQRVCSGENRH